MLPSGAKGDFKNVTRLRLLKKGDLSEFWGRPNVITGFLTVGKQECQSRGQVSRWLIAGFEDGRRGHKPSNAGSFLKLDKARKEFSPRASRRRTTLRHLDIKISDVQDYKIINLCFSHQVCGDLLQQQQQTNAILFVISYVYQIICIHLFKKIIFTE